MKVICLGNYPPRKCGIATFTQNLLDSMQLAAKTNNKELEVEIIAMNENDQLYDYPQEVVMHIRDHTSDDYFKAADYINNSGAEVLLVQHEYGIFGGNSGVLLLKLLRRVNIPIVTTLHTVLESPTYHQKEVLRAIAKYSSRLLVMSDLAIGFLKNVFNIREDKIRKIEHGVPDFAAYKDHKLNIPEGWENRKVILTFGLIGRNKGIEVTIKAMPEIVKKHPDVLFCVMGKTHPHIIKHAGEEYREYLENLTKELGLENHVQFINRYIGEEELINNLLVADIYVTSYHNKAQITSGALSYAVGGGCAVLSTPYWHAEELLANNIGILFDFGSPGQLSEKVIDLLDQPELLKAYQKRAYSYGLSIAWPKIGDLYNYRLGRSIVTYKGIEETYKQPTLNLLHLERLTDNTGVIQFSNGSLPDYKTGYCLDDNARALLVAIRAYKRQKSDHLLQLIYKYATYISLMRNPNGSMKNFMNYNREFIDQVGSDDAFGRAIWALGYLIRYAPNDSILETAHDIFVRSMGWFNELTHLRGYASTMLGLYHYCKKYPDREEFGIRLDNFAKKMLEAFEKNAKPNWQWFEQIITYDNALLPAAMYRAYEIVKNEKYLKVANKATAYLENICFENGYLRVIGNQDWLTAGAENNRFGQQPIDVSGMVILYHCKHQALGDEDSVEKLKLSYEWFLGRNDLCIPIYDEETGGCNDGLEEFMVNRNQGAESTICYLHAHIIARDYYPS